MDANGVARVSEAAPGVLRGVRRSSLAEIYRSASAWRPRDPDRRASDRHACAREERPARSKLRELIQFGGENDSISEKLHRSTLALFSARGSRNHARRALITACKDDFHVPSRRLRLWGRCPNSRTCRSSPATSQELRDYAGQLDGPYCGLCTRRSNRADWFDGAPCLHVVCTSCRCARTRRSDCSALGSR